MASDSVDFTASWTQICNRALGRLGNEAITHLNEGTQTSEFCVRFLPQAIEHVLGQCNFKFARRRIRLALNAERPLFGWRYQFTYPMDLIRIIDVFGGNSNMPEQTELIEYQIENGMILANVDMVQIIYIARPDDPNQLPQSVRNAISTHLAYLLSTPLTSNQQLIALLAAESLQTINQAKTEDAQMNYDPYAFGQNFHTENRR